MVTLFLINIDTVYVVKLTCMFYISVHKHNVHVCMASVLP